MQSALFHSPAWYSSCAAFTATHGRSTTNHTFPAKIERVDPKSTTRWM